MDGKWTSNGQINGQLDGRPKNITPPPPMIGKSLKIIKADRYTLHIHYHAINRKKLSMHEADLIYLVAVVVDGVYNMLIYALVLTIKLVSCREVISANAIM